MYKHGNGTNYRVWFGGEKLYISLGMIYDHLK